MNPCVSGEYDSSIFCDQVSVFENRQTNTGRKISLNVVVIPALHKNSKPPIFCLEGGPGVAATVGGSFYADSINYYRIDHDIILIDVRGTGKSNPLHCKQLQYKEGIAQFLGEMYPVAAVKECYDSLSKLADLTQYTTTNMALDIEDVRKFLGYDKINLFGMSFGTRLAQVYMKMFPRSVQSCVLWSPATTYMKMPLYHARYAEESLRKLFEDCKKDLLCYDSFPRLKEEFMDLMKKGREKPFLYKSTDAHGQSQEITIPWYAFQTKIRTLMYSPYGLRQIPFIIHQSYLGNWQPFMSLYPSKSVFDDFSAEGLYLCVTCAEDVPYITKDEVKSLSKGTFMGDYRIVQQQQACANWAKGSIPKDYFEPLKSEIPTLVLSGYFDPVTPPSVAAKIVETLPNSFLISIPAMSHTYDGLSNPGCFDKIVIGFIDNPTVKPNSACIRQMLAGDYKTHN